MKIQLNFSFVESPFDRPTYRGVERLTQVWCQNFWGSELQETGTLLIDLFHILDVNAYKSARCRRTFSRDLIVSRLFNLLLYGGVGAGDQTSRIAGIL